MQSRRTDHMKINKKYKKQRGENMIVNLMWVWNNIFTSIANILTSVWGFLLAVGMFIGATFAPIGLILCLTFGIVFIDFLLGLRVSIKNKGKGSFESNKARNSMYKLFFYWLFIIIAFFIEMAIDPDMCFGPKVMFGIVGAVELFSIAANGLILFPNMPIFKLFKILFTSEVAKKLDMDKEDVRVILEDKQDELKKDK